MSSNVGKLRRWLCINGDHDLRSQRIKADREYFEPATMQTLVELLDGGHFLNTWCTPRRPDIDKHDFAPQSCELDGLALQVWQGKVG